MITLDDSEFIALYEVAEEEIELIVERGGPGSGHHEHAGRPGEVGGSQPGKGMMSVGGVAKPKASGRAPTTYAEYIKKYDALPTEDDTVDYKSEMKYKVRINENALRIAMAELEKMTPEEIIALDRNKFNLSSNPFLDQFSEDRSKIIDAEGDVDIPGLEGLSPEAKKLFMESYIFAVQGAYDSALGFWHRRLVAQGKISPDDSRLYGGAGQPQGREWAAMPETLYHVTTAADAVRDTGIKSRYELFMSSTKGLGGGESDTISFSADIGVAKDIDRALHEGSAAARGDFTIDQMVRWAAEGVDAPKPYLGFLYGIFVDSNASEEEVAEIDRRASVDPTDIPERLTRHLETYKNRDEEYRDFEFYQRYFANARAHEGGPQYPLFWGVDKKALAESDVSQFTILEFTPVEGSLGYQMSGLGEWRTVGGENVTLVGEHETLTAEEEEEYFGR